VAGRILEAAGKWKFLGSVVMLVDQSPIIWLRPKKVVYNYHSQVHVKVVNNFSVEIKKGGK
jgi:hypothetical protein